MNKLVAIGQLTPKHFIAKFTNKYGVIVVQRWPR